MPDGGSGDGPPVVALRGVSKAYPAVQALAGVDLDVRAGEVHALCGENGAGKSTLLKVLFGAVAPDEGEVVVDGAGGAIHSPRDALAAGVALVAQELNLVPDFTVAQNVVLGQEPRRGPRIDWGRVREEARRTLDELGLDLPVDARARGLSTADQQLVEVARAVRRGARVVVMDEPTSSLARSETDTVLAVVRRLAAAGVGVVYVSHRLQEVLALADRITVLRDGAVVARLGREATEDELVRHMVGRDLFPGATGHGPSRGAQPLLEVDGICRDAAVAPASFQVRPGEILGLAGLVGSGRTELVRLVVGADRPDRGTVRVGGAALRPGDPRDAVTHGVGFLPEDRKHQGLVMDRSVTANVTLPLLRGLRRCGPLLDHARRREVSLRATARVGLRPPDVDVAVRTLSGGNQQKVVLARWLATGARVLVFDEPTRGIDIGAKAEIHRLIVELAADGAAVVVVSSELNEVLHLADRILVMRGGRIVHEAARGALDEEELGRALIGAGV